MKRLMVVSVCVVVLIIPGSAVAQRSGQNASISVGKVAKVEDIDLRSHNPPSSALVRGMLAYHTTGTKRLPTNTWGRATAGAAAGWAIA